MWFVSNASWMLCFQMWDMWVDYVSRCDSRLLCFQCGSMPNRFISSSHVPGHEVSISFATASFLRMPRAPLHERVHDHDERLNDLPIKPFCSVEDFAMCDTSEANLACRSSPETTSMGTLMPVSRRNGRNQFLVAPLATDKKQHNRVFCHGYFSTLFKPHWLPTCSLSKDNVKLC